MAATIAVLAGLQPHEPPEQGHLLTLSAIPTPQEAGLGLVPPTTASVPEPTTSDPRAVRDEASRSYRRPVTPTVTQPRPVAPVTVTPSGAKAFIYNHESGNNPTRVAGNGACGLGQAYPCGKLTCPLTQAGYACQDAWFTRYMEIKFTTWEHAMAVWISRAHRCGNDWCGGSW